jgi:hypothetical protein
MTSDLDTLRDGLAAIDATRLRVPFYGPVRHTLPRLDRAEAKEKYLGDWLIVLLQRVENLEAEVARLRER